MYRICTGIFFIVFLAACVPSNQVRGLGPAATLTHLTVHGEAKVEIPPDQLHLRLSVVSSHFDSDMAIQENNRNMERLIETLQELGLGDEDYRTGQYQTLPEWSRPPRPAPANWQRSIVGYTVTNTSLVETERVDLAGKLLGAAQDAGANQVGGLSFALAEPADHREEAITLATRRAVRKAQTLAIAAGVELGPIQSLTLDQATTPGPMPRMMLMEAQSSMASDAVPVNAGDVEVRAGVTVVFRILGSIEK